MKHREQQTINTLLLASSEDVKDVIPSFQESYYPELVCPRCGRHTMFLVNGKFECILSEKDDDILKPLKN